jgi:hypothetical protein
LYLHFAFSLSPRSITFPHFHFHKGSTMNRMLISVITLLVLVCQATLFADQPSKHALFVAVSKYQHADMNKPQLQYPEDDANALADIFQAGGYKVELLLGKDATQKAIRDKLATYKKVGNAEGALVIGLFGHGVEFEGTSEACFCPYDTAIHEVKDAQGKPVFGNDRQPLVEPNPDSLIKMSEILSTLRTSPTGNRMLLADCCRNSPNRARGRAFGANLKVSDLPQNTAALFACSANEVAFEHPDWGHGAFSKCLIDELKTLAASGEVTAGALADKLHPQVSKLVKTTSNGRATQTVNALMINRVNLQLKIAANGLPAANPAKPNQPVVANVPVADKPAAGEQPADPGKTESFVEDFRGTKENELPDGWVNINPPLALVAVRMAGRPHIRTWYQNNGLGQSQDHDVCSVRLPPVSFRGDFFLELSALSNEQWNGKQRSLVVRLRNSKDEELCLRIFEDNTGFIAHLPKSDESKPFSLSGKLPYNLRLERSNGKYKFMSNRKSLLEHDAQDLRSFDICEFEISPKIMIGSVKIGPLVAEVAKPAAKPAATPKSTDEK